MPLAEPPRRLEVHLSYACRQACLFCSEAARMERWRDSPVTPRELAEVLVGKRRAGFDHVTFTGGEPTLHPAFLGALKAARRLGFRVYVTSNGGSLAQPAFAERALPLIDELCLSVHGDDAASHDACSRVPGSFAKVQRALGLARRHAPRLYVLTNTVVTLRNVARVPALLERLDREPAVRHCLLSNVAPEGRAETDYERLAVPLSRWRALAPSLAAVAARGRTVVRVFGLPLCVLGAARPLSNDLYWSPRVTVERCEKGAGAGLAEIASDAPTRRRVRPPGCAACPARGACGGVFDRYAELFGTAELAPEAVDG